MFGKRHFETILLMKQNTHEVSSDYYRLSLIYGGGAISFAKITTFHNVEKTTSTAVG